MGKRFNRDLICMSVISLIVLCVLMYAGRIFIADFWPEAGTGEYRLAVFETSDVHGEFADNYSGSTEYMLAYISDKVNDARSVEGSPDTSRTVLIDGGDIFQGAPASDLLLGESMSALYDKMEYDAVSIGNHEFDWGLETVIDEDKTMRDYTLDGKTHENKIPVVCSNLYRNGEKCSLAQDYLILNKTAHSDEDGDLNVRIAVIGFADDYSTSVLSENFEDLGYSIEMDYDAVNKLADELESSNQCDATILLSHGNAKSVAESIGKDSCIDIVLGGHMHKRLSGRTDQGLRYGAPSGKAGAYVYTELVFENDGKGGAQLRLTEDDPDPEVTYLFEDTSILADTEENADELDHDIIDLSDKYMAITDETLGKEIGYIDTPATKSYIEGSGRRATTAGNWIIGAIKRATNADVVIYNAGGLRANLMIPEGEDRRIITLKDMYDMLPFDDGLYCYELTYEELLEVFKYSLTGRGRALMTLMCGMDCYFIEDPNDDRSDGRKYRRNILDALVKDGELIYRDGKWKDGWKDRKVKLVVSEFTALTDRESEGLHNPLCGYNETDHLISYDTPTRNTVLEVLTREAEENGGLMRIDTEPHFKLKTYDGPDTLD